MSPVVDETAGDLPVRDVGLMRGGLMPTVPDGLREVRSWKKSQLMKMKDPQRLFRVPRDQLEDLCLKLQEDNSTLRQHTRTQEQRLRRMSTRLVRLRQAQPESGAVKERDLEDTMQELEARVASLESQKSVLQNKLSLARQHILDLGGHTLHRGSRGKRSDAEGGVRRAAQTAPPRYGPTFDDTKTEEPEWRPSMTEQLRMTEMQLTTQALQGSLREKEKEMEGAIKEMMRQQADRHRINIKENVDLIRLQKQLSEKSAALRLSQEKFNQLQESYESQLEEVNTFLKEAQAALLEKVEDLSEQLKLERERARTLDTDLNTATLTLQSLEKLKERVRDLEGERDLIKENYDSLLERTLSTHSTNEGIQLDHKDMQDTEKSRSHIRYLEEMLRTEREERSRLQVENEQLVREKELLSKETLSPAGFAVTSSDQQLHQELLHYKHQVSVLQDKLNSVTKEFDMSVEDLSETLLQIKAFRMQQENRESLSFLDRNVELLPAGTAEYTETVLELQKTRDLLLLENRISRDLQEELNTVQQKMEREREEVRVRMEEKKKLLSKRALQIKTLQEQLKELVYNPRSFKRTIPVQYTWPSAGLEADSVAEEDSSPLRVGESLLEIHIKGATFTPGALRSMASVRHVTGDDIVTFLTYGLLDFEVLATPLVSGDQPEYEFTSTYVLNARDLVLLYDQASKVRVELHQGLGGVRFVTQGCGIISLEEALEHRGERLSGRANITGLEGEPIGVLDFWVRLFPPAEPPDHLMEPMTDRHPQKSPAQVPLGWQDSSYQELHDYGGGIPNEIVVALERCVGLTARWPGLLPDTYLTYRFYDLPPHVSHTIKSSSEPVFNDVASFPLAVTADVLQYLRTTSLWVYVFDDSDGQIPPAYLAKTPVPLRSLSTGREIRGDYVLRDPAGSPRGTIRLMIKWKYPLQPPGDPPKVLHDGGVETEVGERRRGGASDRPVAKPRIKLTEAEPPGETKAWSKSEHKSKQTTVVKPLGTRRPRKVKRSRFEEPALATPTPAAIGKAEIFPRSSEETSAATSTRRRSSSDDSRTQPLRDQESEDNEDRRAADSSESSESSSSQTDIVIIPPAPRMKQGDKLRVEILSLSFEPSSVVAKDKSVQQVYVEYRLLGVPMESTETPMSLRKPTKGEEVHYNFSRVIYVDGSVSAPLRQYLYTMLEGSDPNKGRLKFTVVSEPMDDEDECIDVGFAFLELQELLLTGSDVIERQIDIVSVDQEQKVIGHLKVSLEAARALSGIYREFHRHTPEDQAADEEEEEEEEEQQGESKDEEGGDEIKVIEYEGESDF
ncbi:X-linked retinitis pigmentosa GTPase regulator-interacting protein 1 [Synchiropus picturatus]